MINLEWDDIDQLFSTTTFELNLVSGERLYGTLAETTGDGQVRVQTATETRDLPNETIVRMTPIKATLIDRIEMKVDLGYSLAKANDLEQTTLGYDFATAGRRDASFDIDSATSSSESDPSSQRVFTSFNYQRYLEQTGVESVRRRTGREQRRARHRQAQELRRRHGPLVARHEPKPHRIRRRAGSQLGGGRWVDRDDGGYRGVDRDEPRVVSVR